MNYQEWIRSLNLPSGVGISTSEAFEAGRQSMKDEIQKIYDEGLSMGEIAEDVEGRIT